MRPQGCIWRCKHSPCCSVCNLKQICVYCIFFSAYASNHFAGALANAYSDLCQAAEWSNWAGSQKSHLQRAGVGTEHRRIQPQGLAEILVREHTLCISSHIACCWVPRLTEVHMHACTQLLYQREESLQDGSAPGRWTPPLVERTYLFCNNYLSAANCPRPSPAITYVCADSVLTSC